VSAAATASAAPVDDGALEAVRRADWRFLLPTPRLGRVAYLAPHEPELVVALSLVSRELDLHGAGGPHDVVVVTGGAPAVAPRARELLRPGGWLYAEARGRNVRAWARELEGAGLQEVAAHWLWPDARSCHEITPLEPRPLMFALDRRDPGARMRLRVRAARVLAASGMFAAVARTVAIVGRRP
jgi:hypothetical protein